MNYNANSLSNLCIYLFGYVYMLHYWTRYSINSLLDKTTKQWFNREESFLVVRFDGRMYYDTNKCI